MILLVFHDFDRIPGGRRAPKKYFFHFAEMGFIDSGPKSIFASKSQGKLRSGSDFWYSEKISYYILTTATFFLHSESETKKLRGKTRVYNSHRKSSKKLFFSDGALWWPMKLLPLTLRSPFHSGYECSRNFVTFWGVFFLGRPNLEKSSKIMGINKVNKFSSPAKGNPWLLLPGLKKSIENLSKSSLGAYRPASHLSRARRPGSRSPKSRKSAENAEGREIRFPRSRNRKKYFWLDAWIRNP